MSLLSIVIGLALLVLGRKLFWLFVGGAGFIAGVTLAEQFVHGQPEWVAILLAVVTGCLGAVLSIFLQRFAIGLAGFFLGGYALLQLATGLGHDQYAWTAFLLGGVLGALLVSLLFDWALIVLSSLAGAILIVENARFGPTLTPLLFAGLFVVGILTQRSRGRRPRPAQDQAPRR